MKLTFPAVIRLLGLEEGFAVSTEQNYAFALRVWREKIVAARRTGDEELARLLSQCKEVIKRRYIGHVSRVCPQCGNSKSVHAHRCNICARILRFYSHMIAQTVSVKEYEMELGTMLIPIRTQIGGICTATVRKMATEGQVGDSFLTSKATSTVKNVARKLGLEVIVRIANAQEPDRKKRKYRVWRSDGLDMDGVNAIIKKRMAGEKTPPPKVCVPLPKSWKKAK